MMASPVLCSEPPARRALAGFPGYGVSADGTVDRNGEPLATYPRNGYLRVTLQRADGSRQWRPVHLLVLEAFVGPRPSSRHHGAHFPDNDKRNNRLDNLSWKTPEENERDKRACGTAPRGAPPAPTPKAIVTRLRHRVLAGESFSAIASRYGLHRSSVARIARGERRAS